jgi:hypothetical protein
MTTSIRLRAASSLLLILAFSKDPSAQGFNARADESMAAQQKVNHFMGYLAITRDDKPLESTPGQQMSYRNSNLEESDGYAR